ncbi:hypothetical protein C8Q76DRAFT_341734 [Earliella scabrosa]|nr:hypothetical protein C8Q76DRAFT_341734 [Earliella scabrosa]
MYGTYRRSRARARILYCRSRKLRKERAKTAEWEPRGSVATLRDTGEENLAKLAFGILTRAPCRERANEVDAYGQTERRSSSDAVGVAGVHTVHRSASGRVVTCSWGDEDERDGEDDGHGALHKYKTFVMHGRGREGPESGTRSGHRIGARVQAPSTESDSRPRGPCPPSRLSRGRSMPADNCSGPANLCTRCSEAAVGEFRVFRISVYGRCSDCVRVSTLKLVRVLPRRTECPTQGNAPLCESIGVPGGVLARRSKMPIKSYMYRERRC